MTTGNWAMIERPPLDEGVLVDLRCEICWEAGGGAMLQCSGCKLRVHSACYGSSTSTTGNDNYRSINQDSSEFICCVCVYWNQLGVRVSPNSLVCSLCNRSGGPMKCGVEGLWVHIACVLYSNDGPVFRNYTARACPMNLQKSLRQRLQCHLCLNCAGFSTKCSFPGCNKRMHITCAFQHKLKPKVVLISAKVPLTMFPDATVENCETKTVEKIIKIVTCQQHSSQNAQNAIENYEVSQLQKTDLSRLCQRSSAPADQSQVPVNQPPSMLDPTAAYNPYGVNPASNPGVGSPAPPPPQQQWGYPPQYFYYNQPPMGYYNTWSPHQYGYAQHILQRTAPFPNWGTNQYQMQSRVPQPPTSVMTPTPSMARVRTTQTSAPAAPKATVKAETKKKVKPKAQVALATTKNETSTTSPADTKKKRASTTKAGSNSGGRQKQGDVSAKARDKGKASGGRASRMKSSDDYTGCPTTLRGSRVNWQKLEPFMIPLQSNGGNAEMLNRLQAILDSLDISSQAVLAQAENWSWVRKEDTTASSADDAMSDSWYPPALDLESDMNKYKVDSIAKFEEMISRRPTSLEEEAFDKLVIRALKGDAQQEKKNLSLDVCSWNEIARLESLFAKATTASFFVLLRKVPPELFSSAKHVPTAAGKYIQDKENATFTLDASLLKKTASTTKKVYLHSRFWDLNPPMPLGDSRVLLPKSSYSVSTSVNFFDLPADAVPISDETTREWLTAAQRVRQLRSQQQALGNSGSGHQTMDLSAPDFQKAVRGEEFVKLLSTEEYWQVLLFKDNFVKRQMASILSVWSKRRSRIVGELSRIRSFVDKEKHKHMWVAEDSEQSRIVTQNSNAANRWSSLRWWFQQGHQDPGQSLVTRLKTEHDHRHLIQDGVPPVTGDPNAPGATSTKMYFCMACFAADTDSLNPLVTCIRCGCLAHNFCYAIGSPGQLELESHPWLCDRCLSDKSVHDTSSSGSKNKKQITPPPPAHCAVCLQFGGCLKKLGTQAFVHVTCAIWFFPIINCGDWAALNDWHITLPLKTESTGESLFEEDSFGRARLPEDRLLTRKEIEEMNGRSFCCICSSGADSEDDFTLEKPFGSRGLVVKCAEEDCETYFHPICAWLTGYRVHATPNPYRSLTAPSAHLYLTALDIIPFCANHSEYEGRLDLATIAAHRKRAYCTKTGRFAGSSTNEAKDAGAVSTGTSAKRAGVARSEARRPSLSGETETLPTAWNAACESESFDQAAHTLCSQEDNSPLPISDSDEANYECTDIQPEGEGELWNRLHRLKDLVNRGMEEVESIVSNNQPVTNDDSPDRKRAKRKRLTLFGESSDDER